MHGWSTHLRMSISRLRLSMRLTLLFLIVLIAKPLGFCIEKEGKGDGVLFLKIRGMDGGMNV